MTIAPRSTTVTAQPNVTPMIDVMLVLLIIFMLAIPALSAGFSAVPPPAFNASAHPDDATELGIDASGHYYLNKRPITEAALANALSHLFPASVTDHVLYLRADRNLEYGAVLHAMDLAARHGVRTVAAVTEGAP